MTSDQIEKIYKREDLSQIMVDVNLAQKTIKDVLSALSSKYPDVDFTDVDVLSVEQSSGAMLPLDVKIDFNIL